MYAVEGLYQPVTNSPIAQTTADISDSDTSIPVDHIEYFADAFEWEPGQASLKLDEESESITYTGKTGTTGAGTLTGVTREADLTTIGGVTQGSKKAWAAGTKIASMVTAMQLSEINGLLRKTLYTSPKQWKDGISNKTMSIADGDLVLIESSGEEIPYVKRYLTVTQLKSLFGTAADLTTHAENTANPHSVDKTDLGLSNVTDHAQLKRAAGDIGSFAEKGTPVSDDIILIEDSADSGNKRKVKISSLPTGTGGEANTASSLGTSTDGEDLVGTKTGVDLRFKRLKAGTGVTLTSETNDIVIAASGGGSEIWNNILSSITATPASTSTITTTSDLTGSIEVGFPLRYTIGGTTYYAIVTAITSGLITIAGASLGGTITAIAYGDPARTKQETIVVNGYYGDTSNTILIEDDLFMKGGLPWLLGPAFVVQASYIAAAIDSGATAEKINITIGGSDLLSADATVSTSLTKSIVNINTTNYSITTGDAIEIDVTKGTNGDGHDLVINLVAVFP